MSNQELILNKQVRCVSHEIRNHLSVSDLYCEIIAKHLEKNNVSIPSINNAIDCIRKSNQMIGNSLLELKSFNSWDVKIYDLGCLITQVVELARVYAIDKQISFDCDLGENICVSVDEYKFLACILNLLKNAIEAIEIEGFIKIKTSVENNFVSIKISNNGEKIPEECVNKIFELGETSKSYGSGIGLYLCQQNIQAMEGSLRLNKSTEEITEFEIVFSC